MAKTAGICSETTVLDVGTGVGSVALQLAAFSNHVTGIDISEPFLEAARRAASVQGVGVSFVYGCGNKIVFQGSRYDVVIVSQVFHWLDPVWAARGIYSVLMPNGILFAVEIKTVLSKSHPFTTVLGFGIESFEAVRCECIADCNKYRRIFHLLGNDPSLITLEQIMIFHQTRTFDMDFAKAYFFSDQLRLAMPSEPDPWQRLRELLQTCSAEDLRGDMYWLLLSMRKGSAEHGRARRPLMPRETEEVHGALI